MDGSTTNSSVSFVGIDVAKLKFDVAILPEGARLTCAYDGEGIGQLLAWLPPHDCTIVLEATGGFERRLAAELVDAGRRVAIVNPRQVRDFRAASACWPRTIASMPACWRSMRNMSASDGTRNRRKNSRN